MYTEVTLRRLYIVSKKNITYLTLPLFVQSNNRSFFQCTAKDNCQAHSISLSLSISQSLSLRDRDRADILITLYHHTTHQKLFKCLIGDLYTSVIHHWNHQLKPYWFPLRKNKVNKGHLKPPVSIRVNKYIKWQILKCDTSLEYSAHALLNYTQKK